MPDSNLNDLGVKAQEVGTVEDDVLNDAQERATAAEQEDFDQAVCTLDEQLTKLRSEERALVTLGTSGRNSSKLQAVRKRIDTAVSRKQSLFDARDERRRIANQSALGSALCDDRPGEGESQREFLIRVGKVTPFQGQQGYERRNTNGHQQTEPTRRRLVPSSVVDEKNEINLGNVQHAVEGSSQSIAGKDDTAIVERSYSSGDDDQSAIIPVAERVGRKRPRATSKSARSEIDSDGDGNEDEEYVPVASPACTDDDEETSAVHRGTKKLKKTRLKVKLSNEIEGEEEETFVEGDEVNVGEEEEVEFDGGLRVPASVFDRLFPYQRTGVSFKLNLFPLLFLKKLILDSISLSPLHMPKAIISSSLTFFNVKSVLRSSFMFWCQRFNGYGKYMCKGLVES